MISFSRLKTALIILSLAFMQLRCGNILSGAAGKTSDEAYYIEALKALDARTFDSSISYFQKLSPSYLNQVVVLENYAGAYAGKCGLEFIPFFTNLSAVDVSATTFFKFMMNQWTGVTSISPTSCVQAESLIKQIWTNNAPTSSQQLFMAILSIVKIGTYLRYKADNAENAGGGDGTADGAFDACVNTNDAHHLTDAEAAEIVTGLSLFLQNMAGFVASLSASLSISLTQAQTACALLTPNPCATTDTASVTGAMLNSIRDMLAAGPTNPVTPLGIGTCNNLDPRTCCP